MKKLLVLSFLLTAMSWAQSPPPQASAAGDTNLVFSDDFNTFSFCPTGNGTGCTWYNSGMWWNGIPPLGNSTVSGGNLQELWVRGQSPNDTSISTCARTGSPCKTFNHGYVEASMRWDVVTGSWPAFWMIPVEGHQNQQPQGEIDIVESMGGGNNYTATFHQWNTSAGSLSCGKLYTPASGVNVTNYHTYGVLWDAGTIKFYFDNALVNTCNIGYPTIDAQHYFIILGSQEGVNWTYGNLTGVTVNQIGANFEWVHVWQSGGSSTPAAPSGLTATIS